MLNPGCNLLHPDVKTICDRAESLGLHVAHFNSGVRQNPANGFRVFLGTNMRDYFDEGSLFQGRDAGHAAAFLEGYSAGQKVTA